MSVLAEDRLIWDPDHFSDEITNTEDTFSKSIKKHYQTVCFMEPKLPDKVMVARTHVPLRKYSVIDS